MNKQEIFLVQAFSDGGWAIGVGGSYVGLQEWQFKRLLQLGLKELSPSEVPQKEREN